MWTWKITSGTLLNLNNIPAGSGYSGNGEGLNNPDKISVPDVGPLPVGKYKIGQPYDDAQVGPFALPLIPDPANTMYGRSLFRIHGDNKQLNHSASHGCIILARHVREDISNSGDDDLSVEA